MTHHNLEGEGQQQQEEEINDLELREADEELLYEENEESLVDQETI